MCVRSIYHNLQRCCSFESSRNLPFVEQTFNESGFRVNNKMHLHSDVAVEWQSAGTSPSDIKFWTALVGRPKSIPMSLMGKYEACHKKEDRSTSPVMSLMYTFAAECRRLDYLTLSPPKLPLPCTTRKNRCWIMYTWEWNTRPDNSWTISAALDNRCRLCTVQLEISRAESERRKSAFTNLDASQKTLDWSFC